MKKVHKFVCIECPLSCGVDLIEENSKILEIRGNRCEKGKEFTVAEFTNPVRTLTTTVRIRNGVLPVLPVRSDAPIPKGLIRECMKELAKVEVEAPVKCGEVIYTNILNTRTNIIASRDMGAKRGWKNTYW